ncbi:MAG: heme ABC transporter ATP-binding protein [Rhodobacteraceae bacterium]|nr:heme ABC transporter ATP-binding protein [Paracoccaceae bacterium]
MIEASNISVSYGRKLILDGVSFTAQPGELTAIVGPNGSGKSTLLKALSGDLPYSGIIRLNGNDIARQSVLDLAIQRGVLPQASSLSFPFRVREVIEIGLGAGVHGDQHHITQLALDRVGLAGFSEHLYQELSGGQQQRVQLARVLAQIWHPVGENGPCWLLLDEPVSSLDIAHQLGVMQIAQDFARAGGGVVAVMHDLNLTAMFADRMAVLHDGRCLASGKTQDVFRDEVLSAAYMCRIQTACLPGTGIRYFLPQTSGRVAQAG